MLVCSELGSVVESVGQVPCSLLLALLYKPLCTLGVEQLPLSAKIPPTLSAKAGVELVTEA